MGVHTEAITLAQTFADEKQSCPKKLIDTKILAMEQSSDGVMKAIVDMYNEKREEVLGDIKRLESEMIQAERHRAALSGTESSVEPQAQEA